MKKLPLRGQKRGIEGAIGAGFRDVIGQQALKKGGAIGPADGEYGAMIEKREQGSGHVGSRQRLAGCGQGR